MQSCRNLARMCWLAWVASFGVLALPNVTHTPALAEESQTLRLSCIDFPPFKIAPGGPQSVDPALLGMDVEIIEAAFAGSRFTPQFTFMPFKRAIELAGRGEYDGICGCSYTPEREAIFEFSNPVSPVSQGLFATRAEDLAGITELSDLKGRDVIAVNGYVMEKSLRENGANLNLVGNDREAAIMLSHRPGLILASYRLPVEFRRAREGLTEPVFYLELNSAPNFVCMSRKSPNTTEALAVFNAGLKRIEENGELARIRERYDFGIDTPVN